MIITTENINNKILLAGCCLADKAVDYIQAVNLGDIDKQECLMEKMQNLVFLRKALCGYLPYAEAGARISSAVPQGSLFTAGGLIDIKFNGVIISTWTIPYGLPDVDVLAYCCNQFNTQQTQFVAEISEISDTFLTIYSTQLGSLGDGYILSIYRDSVFLTNLVLGNGGQQPCLASTTDALAKKLIASIDELCGCPCGCNKNIIDDTLPKYIN